MAQDIVIGGRLHSAATGNTVAGANEILDDANGKKQNVINQEVDNEIGTDATAGTIKGRIKELENAVGDGGSVDERIAESAATVKSEITGDAASDYNTLGKVEDKIQAEASRAEAAEGALEDADAALDAAKANKATTLEGYGITDAYTKSETYTKTEVNGLVDTPHQNYVTVLTYAALLAIDPGSTDTIYRVSNYDGSVPQVDVTKYSEYAWDGTQYVFLCVKSQIDEVFDISVYNNNATYADLAAALGTGGANVPSTLRRGGMSIKFVQSSDNKYVQFLYMSSSTAAADFTNVANWQRVGVDYLFQNPDYVIGSQEDLDEYVDVDNRESGMIVFGSNSSTFRNIPNISYTDGAILITLRKANGASSLLDRQFLITKGAICCRAIYPDVWTSWQVTNFDAHFNKYDNFFVNQGLTSFDINALPMGAMSFVSTSVPTGLPDTDYSVGGLIVTTRASESSWTNQDRQFLITNDSLYERVYFEGWTQWFGGKTSGILKETTTNVPNIDTLKTGINSFVSLTVPNGFPTLDYTQGGLIITARQSDEQLTNNDHQYILSQNGLYTRAYYEGSWQAWFGSQFHGRVIECGVGKEYTTLRSAIAAAITTNGTKVVVYPGIYDLAQEFATEIANESGSGILLTNDVHVLFMPGSYVTCEVNVSNVWAYSNFEPFRVDSGNFTLENANIYCKNTRYNVHDELIGASVQYIHRYINCNMEHYDENHAAYYTQCIGGGLGQNGYIEIVGGKYKSTSLYYQTEHYTSPDDMQMPITYHNGYNEYCDSKIVIRDVYLADKGYLRFGNYGPSTILTPVEVCGCRMYKPVFLMNETWDSSQVQNFEIISFNNEIVNP